MTIIVAKQTQTAEGGKQESLFASALAGVGFKIKFKDVFSKRIKPIALGGITLLCVALSSLAFAELFYMPDYKLSKISSMVLPEMG